jgi:hypothetical protein
MQGGRGEAAATGVAAFSNCFDEERDMTTAGQQKHDGMRGGAEMAAQYHTMLDGWAEVSKCCLAAADDIYQTGIDYMKEQVDQFNEFSRDPSAAMREQTVTKAINCSFDAADRIAQAYLHSLENVREPLMRAMSAQLPMGQAMSSMSSFMQRGMERGMQAMEEGAERMERGVRGGLRSAEQGAEEAQQQHHQQSRHHTQGKRKSA